MRKNKGGLPDAEQKGKCCDACIREVVRVGWENVRLPRSAEDCEAMQKMVFGADVATDLEPCDLISW